MYLPPEKLFLYEKVSHKKLLCHSSKLTAQKDSIYSNLQTFLSKMKYCNV